MKSPTRMLVFAILFGIAMSGGRSQFLRASEVTQQSPYSTQANGLVEIGGARTVVFPNGNILEPDGTVITHNGFKFQIIVHNGAFIGIQIYRANGKKLKPGESLLLKNGRVVTQRPL